MAGSDIKTTLDFLPEATPRGLEIAAELRELSARLLALSELLTAESETAIQTKLLSIQEPSSAARWVWDSSPVSCCEVQFEYQQTSARLLPPATQIP